MMPSQWLKAMQKGREGCLMGRRRAAKERGRHWRATTWACANCHPESSSAACTSCPPTIRRLLPLRLVPPPSSNTTRGDAVLDMITATIVYCLEVSQLFCSPRHRNKIRTQLALQYIRRCIAAALSFHGYRLNVLISTEPR